jgi:diguanylate cyclase (GGDEF)-like protein
MSTRPRPSRSAPREPASRRPAAESTLAALVESAPVGLALLDAEGRFVLVNAELARLAGAAPGDLLGRTVAEVAPDLDAPYGVLRDGRSWSVVHFPVPSLAGLRGIVAHEVTALKVVEQQLEELLCLEQSRSVEIEAKNDMLASLASTDALTGLSNRRSFSDALERAIARAENEGGEVAIVYLDVDRFKPVNDVHGHDAGDLALIEIARRLREAARGTDVVARLGGDEFLILLSDLPAGSGRTVATLVCERVDQLLRAPFELDVAVVSLSASAGVAVYPHDARVAERLLAVADAEMYGRKPPQSRTRSR